MLFMPPFDERDTKGGRERGRKGGRASLLFLLLHAYLGSRANDQTMVLRNDIQQLFLREADLVIHFVSAFLEDLDAHLGRGGREEGFVCKMRAWRRGRAKEQTAAAAAAAIPTTIWVNRTIKKREPLNLKVAMSMPYIPSTQPARTELEKHSVASMHAGPYVPPLLPQHHQLAFACTTCCPTWHLNKTPPPSLPPLPSLPFHLTGSMLSAHKILAKAGRDACRWARCW